MTEYKIINRDCISVLDDGEIRGIHTTFFDPPFNQGKVYEHYDDNKDPEDYWDWMTDLLILINEATVDGGSIFLMHREKNAPEVFKAMKEAGWTFQNMIIWRKMTTPTPAGERLSKRYQIVYYGTRGDTPRVYNSLYSQMPMLSWHKERNEKGSRVDDIWYDIRELTSGFFAGDEALREINGKKSHFQQSPLALLVRIILLSTEPNDLVFDPMTGSGTALVAAYQLNRNSIGIEIDPKNCELVHRRMKIKREADDVDKFYADYASTPNIDEIWGHRAQKTLEWFA